MGPTEVLTSQNEFSRTTNVGSRGHDESRGLKRCSSLFRWCSLIGVREGLQSQRYNSNKPSAAEAGTSPEDLSTLGRNSLSLEEKLANEARQWNTTRTGETANQNFPRKDEDMPTKGPLVRADPTETETEKVRHDTTIHRTVRPAVIHETISPIETTITTTNMTIHRHVHHYVHRIQPVLVTSDEEERLVHDIMGEGRAPTTSMTYRQLEMGSNQIRNAGEIGPQGKVCQVCSGATGNALHKEKGGNSRENAFDEDISGESCPICGRNTDQLSQGVKNMTIGD